MTISESSAEQPSPPTNDPEQSVPAKRSAQIYTMSPSAPQYGIAPPTSASSTCGATDPPGESIERVLTRKQADRSTFLVQLLRMRQVSLRRQISCHALRHRQAPTTAVQPRCAECPCSIGRTRSCFCRISCAHFLTPPGDCELTPRKFDGVLPGHSRHHITDMLLSRRSVHLLRMLHRRLLQREEGQGLGASMSVGISEGLSCTYSQTSTVPCDVM